MMCCVLGCSNSYKTNWRLPPSQRIQFYRFPSDESVRKKWIEFCARLGDFNVKNARICSVHFTPEDQTLKHRLMEYSSRRARVLKADAVPSRYDPKKRKLPLEKLQSDAERDKRADALARRKLIDGLLAECTEIANKNSSVAGLNFEVIDVDSIPEPNRLQGTAALREGEIPVNAEQQEVVEWEFEDGTSSSAVDPLSLDEDSTSPQDNPGRLGSNQSCQQKTQNLPSGENHITVEAVEISCVEKEHIVQEASNVATRKNFEGEVSLGSGLTSPSRRVPIRVKREK